MKPIPPEDERKDLGQIGTNGDDPDIILRKC